MIHFPGEETTNSPIPSESRQNSDSQEVETVLLVEDEAMVRVLASRILRARGYKVIEAADGHEAIRIAQGSTEKIHLVMTDMIMPGMSGSEMMTVIKTIIPGVQSLYTSGYSDGAVNGLDSGAAFLPKPFTAVTLACKVKEAIHNGK